MSMSKQNKTGNDNQYLDEVQVLTTTINHQSKKGDYQKNKKEQLTCAKQNKTTAARPTLLDVAHTW